jgi:hypothetical protein
MLTDPQTGYECIAPKISVSLTYVGHDLRRQRCPGTCAYREILAMRCAPQTYLNQLPKVEAVVDAALKQRFQQNRLRAGRNSDGLAGSGNGRPVDAVH